MTDPDVLAGVREDAAHVPGGRAAGLVYVETEADVAAALALRRPVLVVGAQSSLTGGATPRGELVLATRPLDHLRIAGDRAEAAAGVTLDHLQEQATLHDALYPPVPTFSGAYVGGVVATNAAGAATFKHGTTRDWVDALTVVLASGEVLDLHRGEVSAHPDGYFDVVTSLKRIRVPIRPVPRPGVPKCSAGYALGSVMDLIDLFIGAEGTLGVVTAAALRLLSPRPAQCLALVRFTTEAQALQLTTALRSEAQGAWRSRDPRGLDVSSIEHADRRCLALLRDDRIDRELAVPLDADTAGLLLVAIDLPPGTSSLESRAMIENALDPGAPDTPLGRFSRLLNAHGLLDRTELAFPDDATRRRQLLEVREAVPQAVNRRVALAQQTISPSISKMAGDFIVPFGVVSAMEAACREACERRGLDLAIWGHLSDGNIHPNVLPRAADDMSRAAEALLEAGKAVIALGGSPLAEHGVGRNPLKQHLLALLHGPDGIAAMWDVKRALDPEGLFAPGVLLPPPRPPA